MTHKTIVERVADVESAFPRLVEAINDNIDRKLQPVIPLLNALTDLVGREAVASKMKEQREAQATQDMEMRKAQLEVLVKEGRLVKSDTVSDKSVIVARETGADGTVVHPGRFQMMFSEIAPQFQEKLLGKAVAGLKLDLPENQGTFEVLESYEFVPEPAPAAVEG